MSSDSGTPPGNERHERLTELFVAASELDGDARGVFLRELAAADQGLLEDLTALLELDADDAQWLEPPAPSARAALAADRQVGDRIGSYEIVRRLGAGGAGDVYLARQHRPQRLVAIKVMRHGIADAARARKFEFEAQLLARLQHPGIAHVFEADVFEDRGQQRPFFVMEYLADAATLTAYAAAADLSVSARLELFVDVCLAVAHGHQHGIVHCDLKPENLLVGSSGRVKVIDFGIAKAVDRDQRATTLASNGYELAGTLAYMSPEQAEGAIAGLDARTDVYSLGAILYELLAGVLPLDLTGMSVPGAAHRVLRTVPVPLRDREPSLRGDLDTIVSKCLEKDRTRRYGDAGALLRDVQRFLRNEPIRARRPTVAYQFAKFTRRHRGFVAGALLAVVALVVGATLAVYQAVVATRGEMGSRWDSYRASISAAGSAIANHDVALARISLEQAPAEHRNWEWHHLRALLDDSLVEINPPGEGMLGAPFFAMGDVEQQRLVCVWRSGRLYRFDVATGVLVGEEECLAAAVDEESQTAARLDAAGLRVVAAGRPSRRWTFAELGMAVDVVARLRLTVARGGQHVLVTGAARAVRLHVPTGRMDEIVVDRGGTRVFEVAMSANGTVAFAAAIAGQPALWRVGSERLEPFQRVGLFARSVAFDPSGTRIVMGLQDTTVGIWSVADCERVMRGDGHRHAVTGACFSSDGRLVLSVSIDRTMRVWRAAGLAPIAVKHGHERPVRQVVMDPVSKLITTAAEDGTVRLWSGEHIAERGVLRGHGSFVFPTAFSHDGSLVASAGTDRTVRLWSRASQQLVATIPVDLEVVVELAFAPSDRRLVVAGNNRWVVFDLDAGHQLASSRRDGQALQTLRGLAFAGDGGSLLFPQEREHEPGRLISWDVAHGEFGDASLQDLVQTRSASVSQDGRYVVLRRARGAAGLAQAADSDSGLDLCVVAVASAKVLDLPGLSRAFAWLPRGSVLAARSADDPSRVVVLDVATAETLAVIDGHRDRIYDMACSPDGTRLATCGRDGVRLWALGRREPSPAEPVSLLQRVVGRPDPAGHRIVELGGHTSFVWSVAWSADGSTVLTGSGDRTVRLWTGLRAEDEPLRARGAVGFRDPRIAQWLAQLGGPAQVARFLRTPTAGSASERAYLRLCLLASHNWR